MTIRIKTASWILLSLLLFSLLYYYKIRHGMTDFKVFYRAGERFLHSEQLYLASDGHYQFKYPPFFALFMSPIAAVGFEAAKAIWAFIVVGSLTGMVWASFAILKSYGVGWKSALLPTILVMAKFYGRELDLGQANALLGLCLTGLIYFHWRDKTRWVGILLALACFIKPYALVFLPFFIWRRELKVVLIFVVSMIIGILLPVLRFGVSGAIGLYSAWVGTLAGSTPRLFGNIDNTSLIGFWVKWLGDDSLTASKLLWLFISSGLMVVLFYGLWRNRSRNLKDQDLIAFGILLIFIPLFAPLGWDYTFLIATFSMMLLYSQWDGYSKLIRVVIILNSILIGLTIYDVLGKELYSHFMDASVLTVNYLLVAVILLRKLYPGNRIGEWKKVA
ncbi:DUF2029 domain-containing protein [bacterium]|nr:DUF2029 domain-containing protein [bacterium]